MTKTADFTAPPPGIGHNSANDSLVSLVERIERLEEEKKALAGDIKDIYLEGKSKGYDPKILRIVLRLRKMDSSDLAEQEALVQAYRAALGF